MSARKSVVVLSILLILSVVAVSEAAMRGQPRLLGKVVDPDGNPIEGVTVHATSDDVPDFDQTEVTDKKGVFKLDFDTIDVVYKYTFSKPGYITLETEQTWQKDGTARHEFILYPGETPTVEGGVVPVTESPEAAAAYNAAVDAFESEDYQTARAELTIALENDPELRQAWAALSVVEHKLGNYRQAAEAAEKAIELGSTSETVLRTRWDSYRLLGDEEKMADAQADLERIGQLSEEAKRIYNEGVKLLKDGDTEGAFAKFQESLKADPNLEPALLAVATTGLESGHYQEAFEAAETILKENPSHEDAIRLRYNASLKIGDEGLIIGSLVSLAQVNPEVAKENLWVLAMAAYNRNDMEAAKERFNKVLQVDPNNAEAHYLLGLIYLGESNNAEVKKHLERFLELAPDSPDVPSAKDILSYIENN